MKKGLSFDWRMTIRLPLVALVSLLACRVLLLAQPGASSPRPSPMNPLLSDVGQQINRAASTAEILETAAPSVGQARLSLSQGNRIAALVSFRKAQSIIEGGPQSTSNAALLRAFSIDLYQIIGSLDSSFTREDRSQSKSLALDDSPVAVQHFIAFYHGKGRPYWEASRRRLDIYRSDIEPILRERNLPAELIYLGVVESGFNRMALSSKQARGIWQLLPATAQRYGLVQNGVIDERTDPIKSSLAAAEYLEDLYATFGDWYLALAAYNAGERRIQSVINRTGIRDFWQMSRLKLLPPETRLYVPAVLATIAIAHNPEKFGFTNPSQ